MNEKLLELICTLVSEKEDSPSPTDGKTHSFKIGKAYLIRTVTMMYTGRVVTVTDFDIQLEDAAWIADSGRFYNALNTGGLDEVEPYPRGCFVTKQGIIDYSEWIHDLPGDVK